MKRNVFALICLLAVVMGVNTHAKRSQSGFRFKRGWNHSVKSQNFIHFFFSDVKEAFCTFHTVESSFLHRDVHACYLNQTIDSEDFVLGSNKDSTVELLDLRYKKEVLFLPRHIGEKFPKLKEFRGRDCGLTVVREYYFANMGKLQYLSLNRNKISCIEKHSFDDLINVKELYLENNLIVTLDEDLFATMVNLEKLYLNHNKIKFLTPATLKIAGGNLNTVHMRANECINEIYFKNLEKLEVDLQAHCTRQWVFGYTLNFIIIHYKCY